MPMQKTKAAASPAAYVAALRGWQAKLNKKLGDPTKPAKRA